MKPRNTLIGDNEKRCIFKFLCVLIKFPFLGKSVEPAPKITSGKGGFQVDGQFGYGMCEVYPSGMEADASIGIWAWRTVLEVAFDGASHLG